MKAKEYIIQKLVNAGKKHRWMKYPTLALVSLISLFFLIIEKCMERPKRAVIALACMVLIVTQSWYLISIASETDPVTPADTGSIVAVGDGIDGSTDNSEDGSSASDENGASTEATTENTATYTVNYVVAPYGGTNFSKSLSWDQVKNGYLLETVTSTDSCYKLAGWSRTENGALIENDMIPVEEFNGNKNITVYAVWDLAAYRVTYNPGEGGEGLGMTEDVPIRDGVAPTIILSNQSFTRVGYTFDKWMINNDKTNLSPVGAQYTITGTNPDIIVSPYWEPNTYTIEFYKNDELAAGDMENITVAYGETVALPTNEFTKVGYYFAGWVDENGNVYDNAASVSNLSAINGDVVTLKAQWAYQTASASKTEFSYVYDQSVQPEVIDIYHNTVGDGQFTPVLVDVKGETLDGTVNLTNYVDMTGLTVTAATNEIAISTGETGSVKTVGDVTFTFNVFDARNTDEDVISIEVLVHLTEKTLYVINVDNKTKMYDGTAEIPVGTIWYASDAEAAEREIIDGITVNNVSQKGTFTGGELASQAGENKTILLEDIYVIGTNAKYYNIAPTAYIEGGSITKRQVRVTTAPVYAEGMDYILTGQNPKFTVIVNPEDLAMLPFDVAAKDELVIKNAIDNGVRNYYICDYGAPDYLAGNNYTINVDVDSVELNNYYLQVTTGKLVVKQENPVLSEDYSINGYLSEDGVWYYKIEPSIETKMNRNYNCVYIMSSTDKKAVTYEAGLFTNTFKVTEELARGDMYLQLANSETKAVTSVQKLNLKVDVTAPTIDSEGIQVEAVNTTGIKKVGNFLSFGNFFKEELKITVPVVDLRADGSKPSTGEVSGAKAITYYLGADLTGEGTTINVVNGVATFTVPMKYKGEIAFTTCDKAGNVSNRAYLIGVEGSDYWVIENTVPEVVVTAVDNEGNTAFAGEGNYYKSVKVDATVTDIDAGIAYVLWNITKNGEVIASEEKELVSDSTKQVFSQVFTKSFTESGAYTVSVKAYDNAGNVSLEMEPIEFVIDGSAPVITVSPEDYDAVWSTSKTITFTVKDLESGVDMLTMKDQDNATLPFSSVEGETDTYTATVTKKGIYTIKAVDRAGNVVEVPVEFTKLSNETPDNPIVTISPEIPEDIEDKENYWYSENPTITITEPATTPDGTEIVTYYHVWKDGTEEPTYDNNRAGTSFQLPGEGVWNLRVWAETESGKKNEYVSEEDGLYQIRYDGTMPVVSDVLLTGDGTTSRINLTVTEDTSSLVKLEAVYNENDEYAQPLMYDYKGDGVYTASFMATMNGSYTVKATDMAGNVCKTEAFEPISIVVTGITGNTERGITVSGKVIAGTFEIDNVIAKFGLEGGDLTLDAEDLIITTDEEGNKAFTAKFTGLSANSRYRFKITALSANGESCNYTGAFKTAVEDVVGVNVAGTVIDETMNPDDTTAITIMLYDKNAVIQSRNVKNGESFIFTNIPDGIYTIKAMNGNRTVSQGVVISGNTVIDPSEAIELRLRDGQTTDVIYADDTMPQLIVSGLSNIFDDSTNFGSEQDNAIISAGGKIEFVLKVDGLSESEVPENDLARIQHTMNKNETVAMYMDFSIWKRSVGAYGLVSETQVTSIAGGKNVRIVIPLSQELAEKEGLSVIRIHGGNAERLVDLDINKDTYTIESALYSTYALVYTDKTSTDTTEDKSDASTSDNTNSSTSDNNGTGGNNNNNANNNANNGNGTNNGTGSNNGNGTNNGTNGGASASTSDISKKPNSNNSLTQSGSNSGSSPKTGDAAPVVMMGALMAIMACAGIALLKIKKR